jgi:AhpD family alkylhydroperoxidase
MEPRINFYKATPDGINAMRGLEHYINQSSGLEPSLRELVKIRASQINGCAYCIDMHTKDARAAGETEQRLYALNAWRESEMLPLIRRLRASAFSTLATSAAVNLSSR